MHTIQTKGHKIEVYDSIDELPVTRFHAFNRFLLIDSGIGSDLNDFDNHMITLLKYIEKGDTENAKKEAMNIRQNVAFVYDQVSPKLNAFVPLIRSIDGKPLDDLSDESVQAVMQMLGNDEVGAGTIARWVDDAKKKLKSSLMYFFRSRLKVRG